MKRASKLIVRMLGLACALALAGCVDDTGLHARVVARTPAPDALAHSAAGMPAGEWPSADWVAAYGDPQLDALVREALKHNPDIDVARARLASAQSQLDQFAKLTGLTGTVLMSAERARLPRTPDAANVSVAGRQVPVQLFADPWVSPAAVVGALSYQLDLWGKNAALTRALFSNREAARADAAQAQLALTVALVTQYCELDRSFAMRDVLRQKIAALDGVDATLKERAARGIDNAYDASDAALKRAQLLEAAQRNDERITLAQLQLGVLSGLGPERGLDIGRPRLASLGPAALPANLPLALLGRRPDIVAAKLRAQAALAKIDATRAAFYPDINLSAVAGFTALNLGSLFSLASLTGAVGPAISLPIFDRSRLRAQLGGDYASADAAVGLYNQAVDEALGQVAKDIASLRSLDALDGGQRQATDAAATIASIAAQRHRRGIGTRKDAVAAELSRLDQQAQQIELDSERRVLQTALAGALGGGFDAAGGAQAARAAMPAAPRAESDFPSLNSPAPTGPPLD